MSIGSLGIIGSVAATPASQAKAGIDKAQEATAAQERRIHSQAHTENAAGIGTTESSTQTSDRDADGRRLWELPPEARENGDAPQEETAPKAIDPTGTSGSSLDLSG